MIDRIEFMHKKSFIHRDIKPDNFLIGLNENSHIIYIIDFGLSEKYRNSRTYKHIPFSTNNSFVGTARYSSINSLKGYSQSRRDDLESLGYVLLYFLKGSLPWQGLKIQDWNDKHKKILEIKTLTSTEELCEGFPKEFMEFLNYAKNLKFEDEPNYNFLRGLLFSILEKQKDKFDFWYDWVNEKPNITDKISIERYIKNNTRVSFEYGKIEDEKNIEEIKGSEKKNINE